MNAYAVYPSFRIFFNVSVFVTGTYMGDASNNLNIGNVDDTSRTWDGKIDEFRIYDGILSSGWISTEYNNQNNPAMFYTVGTQEIQ